jgi:hypothetical protein
MARLAVLALLALPFPGCSTYCTHDYKWQHNSDCYFNWQRRSDWTTTSAPSVDSSSDRCEKHEHSHGKCKN